MGFAKEDKDKQFECRGCGSFFDIQELEEGCCPNCGTDEHVFENSIEEE